MISSDVMHFREAGSGSESHAGVTMPSGETISPYEFTSFVPDYRDAELGTDFILPKDGLHFQCLDSRLSCQGDFVSADSDARLDIATACSASGRTLSCNVSLSPASSTMDITQPILTSDLPVRKETQTWMVHQTSSLQGRSAARNLFFDVYDGRAEGFVIDIITSIAHYGLLMNAANLAQKEPLDLAAHQKYGIPFSDGTTDLQSHVDNFRSKIHPPFPQHEVPDPYLNDMIAKYLEQQMLASQNPSASLSYSLTGLSYHSEFDRVSSALLFSPIIVPTNRLGGSMNQLAQNGDSVVSVIYPYLSEGTMEDQAQRLRAVYELENGRSPVSETEQELANAALWLDVHDGLSSVSIKANGRKGDVFDSNVASMDSRNDTLVFDSSVPSDYPDALYIQPGRITAQQNVQFYFILQKGALKNQYSVIVSRTPVVQATPTPQVAGP